MTNVLITCLRLCSTTRLNNPLVVVGCIAIACLTASTAAASITTLTAQGTVRTGVDNNGAVFGASNNLAGQPFTLVLTIDDEGGAPVTPNVPGVTSITNVKSAIGVITINGKSISLGTLPGTTFHAINSLDPLNLFIYSLTGSTGLNFDAVGVNIRFGPGNSPFGGNADWKAPFTYTPKSNDSVLVTFSYLRGLPISAGAEFNVSVISVAAGGASSAGTPQPIVEYYHAGFDHYFITWVAAEIANLDSGATRGWARTQQSFPVFSAPQAGTSAACRIYIPPGKGDGHFFGRDTNECNGTMTRNPTFILESPSFFHLYLPSAGNCGPGTVPVYRVFSNRADANHRYTTDRATRDLMVSRGWLAEGDGPDTVAMCAPQ